MRRLANAWRWLPIRLFVCFVAGVSMLMGVWFLFRNFNPEDMMMHGAGTPVSGSASHRLLDTSEGTALSQQAYAPVSYASGVAEIPDGVALKGVVEWNVCYMGAPCAPHVSATTPRAFTAVNNGTLKLVGLAGAGIRCKTPDTNTAQQSLAEFPQLATQLHGKPSGFYGISLDPGRLWFCAT